MLLKEVLSVFLHGINIPQLAQIGEEFAVCEAMREISLPANLSSISVTAFSGCKSLQQIIASNISDGIVPEEFETVRGKVQVTRVQFDAAFVRELAVSDVAACFCIGNAGNFLSDPYSASADALRISEENAVGPACRVAALSGIENFRFSIRDVNRVVRGGSLSAPFRECEYATINDRRTEDSRWNGRRLETDLREEFQTIAKTRQMVKMISKERGKSAEGRWMAQRQSLRGVYRATDAGNRALKRRQI
jgi:hypothetical protein